MVEPNGFTYNKETAQNNHFQNPNKSYLNNQITELTRRIR